MTTKVDNYSADGVQTVALLDSVGTYKADGIRTSELAAKVIGGGEALPPSVTALLERVPEKSHGVLLDSMHDAMGFYEKQHGFKPDASLVATALQQAFNSTFEAGSLASGKLLDDATNVHHDQLSLQANRAIVSVMSLFSEAIPFANYLPTDIGSNEAKLIIVNHQAGSDFGGYSVGNSLNGVNGGLPYIDSERLVELTTAGGAGPFAGVVTNQVDPTNTRLPLAVSASNPAVKLLRGRSLVYVNGVEGAIESPQINTTGNNPIMGSVTIGAVAYAVSGTIDASTGAYSVSFAPALPANTIANLAVYVDYEAQPLLAPELRIQAETYTLRANASRAIMQVTPDAETQFRNEAQIDAQSQMLMVMRNQYAAERHYSAIGKMRDASANSVYNFDFNYSGQISQKTTAQMVSELAYILSLASQEVSMKTQGNGITHLYVTGLMAARFIALPNDVFTPSGIYERPGVFRLGTFLGKYEVYYTPKGLTEANTTTEILCVSRATDPARNPLIMGDAVPPIFIPLSVGKDFKNGQGFYTRNFTRVNPHAPSAKGAAIIRVINTR